jgi:hypothetical protein
MGVGALDNDMPLFCELGWHRPEPVARWNNGYYFTRCTRCGQDLVRTAYGGWQVPYGYRVVWQAEPPANGVSAALVEEPAESVPAGGEELPIQEVLRHLQDEDSPAEAPADDIATAAQDEVIAKAVRAPRIPDFMDDAAAGNAWDSVSRADLARPGRAERDRDSDGGWDEDRGPGPFSRLKARFAGLFERDPGEAIAEPIDDGPAPAGLSQNMRLALIAAVPIILVLLVLVLWSGREGGRAARADDNSAQSAESSPDSGLPAFVTASALNCRAAPAREAESVAVMARGDPVSLLARDGDWVSLVHEGGQCWALVRYFSVEQPL